MTGSEQKYDELAPKDDPHDALSDLDRATILRCIDVVAKRSEELKHKGVNSWSFFFGVTNLLLVTWCIGVFPEHFWLVYVLETLILFPIRYKHMVEKRPLPDVLSWLDFCWIANIICNIVLIIYLIDDNVAGTGVLMMLDPTEVRKTLFCAFFGVACGPLLCAVGALGNALVFHDADNTVSVFIHLGPSLLMYTLRWQTKEVLDAWPGLFNLTYLDSVDPFRDVYCMAVAGYFVWWVPFTVWMLCCGLGMPAKGYDTVFHSLMRGSNPVSAVLGWSKEEAKKRAASNDFTTGSVLVYMLFHALAVCLAMLLSMVCYTNRYCHGGLCIAMALAAIYKGAARYSFYITDQYTSMLRKEFGAVLQESP